tara:strand:+ start:53322 stop:53696 length:375 start_codon:yes stop_codon:yes gene_type:complete
MDAQKIIIKHQGSPLFVRVVLLFIGLLCFLIPLVGLVVYVVINGTFHFGLIINFLLFWALGHYILRVATWNSYGREILTLKADRIEYYADYKYFRDSEQILMEANNGLGIDILMDEADGGRLFI